ncbi:MAG: efflux RND transporter periplasmic adaptor subunit, partial [Pirellulaceae bacterium]
KIIGQILAVLGLFGLLIQPLWRLVQFFYFPGRIERVNKHRTSLAAALALAILVVAAWLPLPHRVRCTLYVKPCEAASVYVESAGTLSQIHVRPGDWVEEGQPIVTLKNIDVQLAIERLLGERQRLESRLRSLRQRAFEDDAAGMEIAEVEKALAATDEQLAARTTDLKKLTVLAPVRGVVMAPPRRPPAHRDTGHLPPWSGTPFDSRNLTAYLSSGAAICDIGDPNRLEAILAVDEGDVEFLRPGQTVELFLDQLPSEPFSTQIEQLSQVDMKFAPRSLSSKAGGELASRTDSLGRERTLQTMYQASARLMDDDGLVLLGATGQARVHTRPQTVAQRLWRYLCQTFTLNG